MRRSCGVAEATLAGLIRRYREAAGLSQARLAGRVGYTRQYVSRAEQVSKGLPSTGLVAAIDREVGAVGALVAAHAATRRHRLARRAAELIDLPAQVLACGARAGLVPTERCVALLARAADVDLVARGSFFQRDFIRKQRDAGLPMHLIAHEDVLIFRASPEAPSSGFVMAAQEPRPILSARARHAEKPTDASGASRQAAAA